MVFLRCAALLGILALPLTCAAPAAAQSACGQSLLESFPDQLRALEAQHPAGTDDAVRRARTLSALLDAPALSGAVAQACPGDSAPALLQTLARQRLLVLWAKMLVLDAIDMPVYAAPYDRRCSNVDGATWQSAFIRAYVERLDPQGSDVERSSLRRALDDDPLAAHVREAVAARAQRLRIGTLPGPDSDEAAWLQSNELARSKALAALTPGLRCGAIAGAMPITP